MSAFAGARTGWNGYGALGLHVGNSLNHSDYATRLSDYALFEMYFENTVYSNINSFSVALKVNEKLYRYTSGLFNPIKRENDLYVANVYQGSLDTEDLGAGAMPLAFTNEAMEKPLKQVIKSSNLGQSLSRYTSETALYGDGFIYIVDDPVSGKVRLEFIPAWKVRDLDSDEVGNFNGLVFEYEKEEDPHIDQYQPKKFAVATAQASKTFVYTMKMTKVEVDGERVVLVETFKDGDPFAFYHDADGTALSKWQLPYSFIPCKRATFEQTSDGWGRNSFYASRTKIDQLNSVASQLNASIKRVIEPIITAKNTNVKADANGRKVIDFSTQRDDATGISVLFFSGDNADIQALNIPLDIAATSAHIKEMLAEVERDMPVLALQRIREQGALTAPGVRSGYSDAIGKIESARKNLDPPLVAALQMAITIGGIRGYEGFEGFNADSYANGDMDLRIKERSVMPDELSSTERLLAYGTVKDLPPGLQRRALMDMGVPKAEIDEIVNDAAAQQQASRQDQINANDATAVQALLDKMGLNGAAPTTPAPPLEPTLAGALANVSVPA